MTLSVIILRLIVFLSGKLVSDVYCTHIKPDGTFVVIIGLDDDVVNDVIDDVVDVEDGDVELLDVSGMHVRQHSVGSVYVSQRKGKQTLRSPYGHSVDSLINHIFLFC